MRDTSTTSLRHSGSDTLFVNSIEKGFCILDAFRQGQRTLGLRDLSLKDISELTGLDKSAVQRFTNTFVILGYLEKDPHTRRYSPANRMVDFYYTYLISNRIAEIAMPRLIEASRVYDTTVNLCELSGSDLSYIIRIPHEKAAYRATLPGRRIPAFYTAGGMVILAGLPPEEAKLILDASDLKPATKWTITDRTEINARLEQARKNGYDIGIQQSLPQEISTAAPVLDNDGKAIAAIQIPVYMPRWNYDQVVEKIVPLALETARMISGSLHGEA